MNDAAVQAYQKDAIIGHRPTWAMGVNPAGQGKPADEPPRDWAYVDPLGILRGRGRRRRDAGAPASRSRRSPAARRRCAAPWT